MPRVAIILFSVCALVSAASATEDSRGLRREGKKAGADENAGALPEGESESSSNPGRSLSKRRGFRDRAAGAATSASTPTSSAPAVSCCWQFVEATKRYQYYVRPANTQCAASYKLAQCPKNAAAPSTPASAPGAATAPAAAAPAAATAAAASSSAASAAATKPAVVAAADAPSVSGASAAAAASSGASVPTSEKHAGGGVHAGHQRISASPPPSPSPAAASAASKTPSGGGGLTDLVLLLIFGGLGYIFRGRLMDKAREFFPAAGATSTITPAKDGKSKVYRKVAGGERDDDASSQTSNTCGLSGGEEEVDPIAEEWAARLAAQREGRAYIPKEAPSTAVVCTGCGGGAVPSFAGAGGAAGAAGGAAAFQTPRAGHAAEEEAFAGFEAEADDEYDERAGGWNTQPTPQTAAPPGMGGMGARGMGGPSGVGQPDWGSLGGGANMNIGDVSALDGFGQPKPPPKDDIDWGILGDPSGGDSGDPFAMGGGGKDVEAGGGGGAADDEEDDEFTVFAGFDRDNKPTNKKSAAQARGDNSSGSGLSWDAERKVWEQQNKSSCTRHPTRPCRGRARAATRRPLLRVLRALCPVRCD